MSGVKLIHTKLIYYFHHIPKFNVQIISTKVINSNNSTNKTREKHNSLSFILVIFLILLFSPITHASQSSNDKILQGKKIINQSCIYCHQEDAIGKPGVAPSLTNKEFLSIASDKFLTATIREGRPGTGMPPFAHLADKIDSVVAYLRSKSKLPSRAKEIDQQAKAKGDALHGKHLFDKICAGCHGKNGDGYSAGGTGTAIGKVGFLSHASDGFMRTTIKEGRSNTRMRSFQGPAGLANLSDQEIDNIIAYLRTVPSK
ncbi:MAG: c-type cytochrome [Gammaproteobacteria bacterium]|nr:c-type cytochrome [Gammaproteobacteria bacterium]